MGLGPNSIVSQNDADFSGGTIGNWVKTSPGVGTLTYNTDNIGGDDNQQALLTAGTGDSYIYADLDSPVGFVVPPNARMRFQIDLYMPVANVQDDTVFVIGGYGVNPNTIQQSLTKGQWVTVHLDTLFDVDVIGDFRIGIINNPTVGDRLYFDNAYIGQMSSSGLTGHSLGMGL